MSFSFDALSAKEKVSAVYLAYYGRVADAEGRAFWASELEQAGGSLDAIIDAFGNSAEANQRYGSRDASDAITVLYQDLFGRAPDDSGLAFYSEEIEAGRITLQSLALDVLNGSTGADADLINSRLAVAEELTDFFASNEGEISAGLARLVVGGISDNETGLSTITEWLDGLDVEVEPAFSAVGTVLADGQTVDAPPTSAASLTVGGSGSAGVLDLNETGNAEAPTLVLSGADGGALRAGLDELGAMLRVDGGSVTTEGAGNQIVIGDSGPAIALVEDGATLSTVDLRVGDDARGEMMLTGMGTTATVSSVNGQTSWNDSGFLGIGNDSYGRLTASDGATLEVITRDGEANGAGINLGDGAGGQGELIVDNATVDLRDTDGAIGNYGPYTQVGRDGSGRLELRNEAEMTLSARETFMGVGNADEGTAGSGVLRILDGAALTMTTAAADAGLGAERELGHSLQIGRDGASGDVAISDGGRLEIVGRGDYASLRLGVIRDADSAGEGTLRVSGAESALEVRNENTDGNRSIINVGDGGKGTLRVENGASTETEVIVVGQDAGGDGELVVTGADSTVNLTGAGATDNIDSVGPFLVVGQFAGSEGAARISDGASMVITKDEGTYTGMQVGVNAGSRGVLTVEGAGSELLIRSNGEALSWESAFVEIGRAGTGTLNILDGGRVVHDELGVFGVGTESGDAVGRISVTGNNSLLDAGGIMIISGTSEDELINRDALNLSGGGQAEVVVGEGATLRAGEAQGDGIDDIFIGENGTLRVEDGGTIEADVNTEGGGTFVTGNSPGWATINGDLELGSDVVLEFAGTDPGQYDRLDIQGEAIVSGLVTLDFSLDAGLAAGDRFAVIEADAGLDMESAELDIVGLAEGLNAQTSVTETTLYVELI